MSKRFGFLSLLLVFTLALAACAGNANEAPEDVLTPTEGALATLDATAEGPEEVTDVPAATPAPGEVGAVDMIENDAVDPSRVSSLIGYGINTADGEGVGHIDSLIVDRTGQIQYALVDPDDAYNLEEGLVAVPWSALQITDAADDAVDAVVFTSDADVFANAPLIDPSVDVAAADFDADVRSYWANEVAVLPQTGAGDQAGLLRLRDVTDHQVLNTEGEDLGDVEDMILNPVQGLIHYIILAQGGLLDLGEQLYPVPFENLQVDEDGNFVLNISQEQLENAPTIDLENYPDIDDDAWDDEYEAFWAGLPAAGAAPSLNETPVATDTMTSTVDMDQDDYPDLLSEVLGMDIEDASDEDLGDVHAVVVDRASGNIIYAIVDADDDLGLDNDFVAIPWDALTLRADEDVDDDLDVNATPAVTATQSVTATAVSTGTTDLGDDPDLVLNLDREVLVSSPSFAEADFADIDFTAPDWDADWRSYWSGQAQIDALGETGAIYLDAASDLQLLDANGEDIGDIEDFIVDHTEGVIRYGVWASGGILDIGEEMIPVPFEHFDWDAEDDVFSLNIDPVQLEDAPRFPNADEIPNTNEPGWDDDIQNFWNNLTG